MPKLEINYANTEIYKIVPLDGNLDYCYVGHTTNFNQRKKLHKSNCNNPNAKIYNLKLYKTIRDNRGWDNWIMVYIEKFPCENKRQAEAREEELRKELNGNLNAKKSFITEEEKKEYKKEYYELNKEEIKEYYEENKEEIAEKRKEYYKENEEKFKEYLKKYRLVNKEKIKKDKKEWYEKNKEKQKEKFTCECGSFVTIYYKSRHEISQKHVKFIENSNI